MTPQELIAKCIDQSLLTEEQVAELPTITRFGQGEDIWAVKAQAPGVPGLTVFAIFEGNQRDVLDVHLRGDVRIFCMPTAAGNPYCRVALSRMAPTLVRTDFKDAGAFAEEVGEEWDALGLALGIVEDDNDAATCPACGADTEVTLDDDDDEQDDEPKFCGKCGKAFPEIVEEPEPKAEDAAAAPGANPAS